MAVFSGPVAGKRTLNSRRQALMAFAAVAIAPRAACAGREPRSTGVEPDRVGASVRAFALMRGALDERIVIGNVLGIYHGVVGTVVEPLFGLVGATFSRYMPTPGGVAIVSFEQAYYTSIDGFRVLDEWRNPYTGATVRVPVWTGEPIVQFVDVDLQIRPAKPLPPSVRVAHNATAFEADPDEVMFVEHLSADWPGDGGGRDGYSEIVTLRAPRSAVAARNAIQVGCQTSFTSVVSWRDWLGMGDRPGHLMAHGAGAYGLAATRLPALFVEETRRRRPQALSDPQSILAPALREAEASLAKR